MHATFNFYLESPFLIFKVLNQNNNILTCYYLLFILYNNHKNNKVVCINYELQTIEGRKRASIQTMTHYIKLYEYLHV